jgi:NADH:ubiquinone oxidoreductase subunit 5 (subunit L)/multisubunit Na+/H+ antiporter MnhA subunit
MGAHWLWALPGFPALVGGLLLIWSGRARPLAGPVVIIVNALVLALAIWAWLERPSVELAWLPQDDQALRLHLSAADQAAPLATMVAAVALLVMVYSQGYLERDEARGRFFGFMALFLGAMLWLVLADDLLTILMGWELVGLCSYALIGFWHREPERVRAGNRAFLTTRSADLGLYLAAMAAFAGGGELGFADLPGLPSPWRDVVATGLITAAAGKSAQLPFSGWLSGAMLGPSPVSALLHSATMVAAGIVLLIKALPLLEATGWALPVVLWLGVLSAIALGLVALYQGELKQLIAASTVSQYGYMFAGAGAGGVASTSAYLANHAAFKALLFLVAGVLLHQGMRHLREMGGLASLRIQAGLFLIGATSLAALPPLGGFFSKEALLARVEHASLPAFVLLLVGSLLTAAYAARAWLGAFGGDARSDAARHPHEPGFLLQAPSALLALAALLLGALALPPLKHWWPDALGADPLPPFSIVGALLSLAAALAGVAAIWTLHRRGALVPMAPLLGQAPASAAADWLGLVRALDGAGRLVVRGAQAIDRIERTEPATHAGRAVARFAGMLGEFDTRVLTARTVGSGQSVLSLARALGQFDAEDVDQATAGQSDRAARLLARLSQLADRRLWDGAIARLDQGLHLTAGGLSQLQSGLLHQYYALAATGIALLFVYAFLVLRF